MDVEPGIAILGERVDSVMHQICLKDESALSIGYDELSGYTIDSNFTFNFNQDIKPRGPYTNHTCNNDSNLATT